MIGHILEIKKDWDDLYQMRLDEFDSSIGALFDTIIEDNGEQAEEFLEWITNLGVETGIQLGFKYFELTEESRRAIFIGKFNQFKASIKMMTLDDFISINPYTLVEAFTLPSDIEIYAGDGASISLDQWLRESKPGRYYVGKVFNTFSTKGKLNTMEIF